MSSEKKQIRQQFRDAVFHRDGNVCRVCRAGSYALDAHHITDRHLMPNEGYVKENGISLCPTCHEKAEVFHNTGVALPHWEPENLYVMIESSYEEAIEASKRLK